MRACNKVPTSERQCIEIQAMTHLQQKQAHIWVHAHTYMFSAFDSFPWLSALQANWQWVLLY